MAELFCVLAQALLDVRSDMDRQHNELFRALIELVQQQSGGQDTPDIPPGPPGRMAHSAAFSWVAHQAGDRVVAADR